MILFINGLQWKGYKRYQFGVVGEGACSDSWCQALAIGGPSLSIPCFAIQMDPSEGLSYSCAERGKK